MSMKNISLFCIGLSVLVSSNLLAWDGYDYDIGESIEIERGNLVRDGEDIEVYHYGDGSYHDEEVQEMANGELETYDYDLGEYHNYEMD